MRVKNRLKVAAVLITPFVLMGVVSDPAQAASKGHSCSAGGFYGSIDMTGPAPYGNIDVATVSYKILKGTNVGGNSANVYVSDGGLMPSRQYQVTGGIQNGLWHKMQGPYNRGVGSVYVKFTFDKSNAPDPSCSFYL